MKIQDVLVINRDAPAQLLRNQVPTRGNWVLLDIRNANGAPAIGATLRAVVGGETIHRTVHTDGSYLAASDPRVHLGLGLHDKVDEIEVTWPNGNTITMKQIPAGSIVRIDPTG